MAGKRENEFQRNLIRTIKDLFPGCIVLKNDANYIQGIPDLSIFYKDKWAMLECKRSASASLRPNQDTWCKKADDMSFCRLIFPENEEEVLNELQQAFKS